MTSGVAQRMRGQRGLRTPVIALAMCLLGAVAAGDAAAATGDLIQKSGLAGCISETGAGPCVDGTAIGSPLGVVVSPDGRNAYAASSTRNAVAVFDRAPDGTLTQKPGTAGCISDTGRSVPNDAASAGQCVDGEALANLNYLAVSPDGKNVYVVASDGFFASSNNAAVAVFDRAADGTLTQKIGVAGCITNVVTGGCATGKALNYAINVTVAPDGKSVYVASYYSGAVAVFDRAANGALTQKPGTAGCISDTGRSIPGDPASAGQCVDGRALAGPQMVTVSPDGQNLYYAAFDGGAVAVFDRATNGTLTQKPGLAGCISANPGADLCADGRAIAAANWVEVSRDGKSAYVASYDSNAVAVFDRATNGTLTQKPGTAGCISDTVPGRSPVPGGQCVDGKALARPVAVMLSPDGKNLYATSQTSNAVAVFDRALGGALTQKPGTAGCVSDTGRSISDQVSTAGQCADGTGLAFPYTGLAASPDGKNVYVGARTSQAVSVFDREPLPPPVITPTPPTYPRPASVPDTTKPLLSALSLSPRRFRAAGSGPSIATRIGSRASYRLSERAAVRFRVERALPGRRVGGRCVKPKRSHRRARRCTRYVTLRGAFTHQGTAGPNRFKFTGRLRGRKLRPGRYRLRAVATDPAGNKSRTQRSPRFRIARR